MDFLEPDWVQERPTTAELRLALRTLQLAPAPIEAPALGELLSAFRATHVNGGALFGRFEFLPSPVLHWFGSRNRWEETSFFQAFLTSEAVRTTLPELQVGPGSEIEAQFEWGSSFTLSGEFARALVAGGAYVRFPGTPREAKVLAERACDELIGDRFAEVFLYRSFTPWSPWFHDVAWDVTWLGVDKRHLALWLFCLTDTD